jgi:SAM-dependent methyltransferase
MKFGIGKVAVKEDAHHHTSMTKPCDAELNIFLRYLESAAKGVSEPRILIIGCSPELREIAAKFKARTTVVANDLEVIERTANLMKTKNKKEEWLEGDIMVLPLQKKSFDLIFSDHVLSNVSPFNKENFYGRMKEILKNEGSVVIRSVVFKKTAKTFEGKLSKYFRIIDKKFGKEGIFSEYFPIYFMKPK